jgi:hypothetical protein
MAKLNSIKIYEDGTMVAITTIADVPISSEPFGNVRLRPFGTSGISFVRLSTNEAIAEIADFSNILDESGVAYSVTYLGAFNALNAFLDKCCNTGDVGEVNTASNVGAGEGVFKQKTGVDLQFKTLIAGGGIQIQNNANNLTISKIDEIAQISGPIITPAILTATANNYNPPGFATANMIRQDINANNRSISGFVAPAVGINRVIYINNINGTGDDLRFLDNSILSTPENRILLRDNNNKSIKDNETAAFWYDHTSQRWRPFNRVG